MGYLTSKDYGARVVNGRLIALLLVAVVLWFAGGAFVEKYATMPGSAELQTGQRIMHQMAGGKNLRQVGFFETYPKARPSDFVALISDTDHQLWPPTAEEDARGRAGIARSNSRVLMPDGLVFSPRERRTEDSDEIVFAADDQNLQLIVRGYSPGEQEVTFEYRWDFPTKAAQVPLR